MGKNNRHSLLCVERFRRGVQRIVKKRLGDEFTLFRGVSPKELESIARASSKADLPPLVSFTPDLSIARGFAKTEGILLKARAKPSSVQAVAPNTVHFGDEAELFIDTAKLESLELIGFHMDDINDIRLLQAPIDLLQKVRKVTK